MSQINEISVEYDLIITPDTGQLAFIIDDHLFEKAVRLGHLSAIGLNYDHPAIVIADEEQHLLFSLVLCPNKNFSWIQEIIKLVDFNHSRPVLTYHLMRRSGVPMSYGKIDFESVIVWAAKNLGKSTSTFTYKAIDASYLMMWARGGHDMGTCKLCIGLKGSG